MFVVIELLFVHAAQTALLGLLLHLAAQELLVLLIDSLDLRSQALLLQFVVVLISAPDNGLLVVLGFLDLLAQLLLLHLAREQRSHLLLLLAVALGTTLVLKTRAHFFFHLVLKKSLLLGANTSLLLADDFTGKSVHEVLRARFARLKLAEAISLLLVEHLSILNLSLNISSDLSLAVCLSLLLVGLVLAKHFLQVLLLLTTFLLLEVTLHLHLLLETVDELDLSLESLLIFVALAFLLITKLPVATFLLLHDLFAMRRSLLLLALTEQLDVFGLKSLVHAALLHFTGLALFLFAHLLVELASDQLASLLLAHDGLLLLLVMKQGVELLNGCPLVLLGKLRVNLGLSSGTGSNRHLIGLPRT